MFEHVPKKYQQLVKEALDFSKVWKGTKEFARVSAPYVGSMLAAAGLAGTLGYWSARDRYLRAAENLKNSHDELSTTPQFKENPAKYSERFRELALVSPTLASNPSMAHKVISGKLDTGFSVDDIHRLASIEHIQSQTPRIPDPAGAGIKHFVKNLEVLMPITVPHMYEQFDRSRNIEEMVREQTGAATEKLKSSLVNMSKAQLATLKQITDVVMPEGPKEDKAKFMKSFHNMFEQYFKTLEGHDMEKKSSGTHDVELKVSEECMGRMLATRYCMYKEAGVLDRLSGVIAPVGKVLKSSGNATVDYLKIMSVPLAIGIGFGALNKMMQARESKGMQEKADAVFAGLRRSSDIVKENPDMAAEAFDSLKSFAPVLAVKPIVARTFVEHVVQSGGRLGPESANMLAEAQQKIQDVSQLAGGRPGTGFFAGLKDPLSIFSIKMPGTAPEKKG